MSCATATQTTGTVYQLSLPRVVAITVAAKPQLIQRFAGLRMHDTAAGSAGKKAWLHATSHILQSTEHTAC